MRIKALLTTLAITAASLPSFASNAANYTIYPVPRTATAGQGSFNLDQAVTIAASDGIDAVTRARVAEVLDKAGITYTESSDANSPQANLLIGVCGSGDAADTYALSHSVNTSAFSATETCYDPYVMHVDNDVILILGDKEGSAFYALATLEQMLEQSVGNTLPAVTINDYAHAKYRGIVEGFYGHPWSMESRLNLLDYMKRYKMNYYVYGPKADPYHAGNWRSNYPETVTEQERKFGRINTSDIQQIATKAAANHVDFVWAIHPTLGASSIDLSWVDDIMTKFEQLYSLGVRHFGVSVDDMSGHPSNQAQLPHLVQQAIDEKWNTADAPQADRVGNVLFVPTCYALNYNATYSLTKIKDISPKVEVGFTGYDCFSNVRASSFATMADLIGRDPIFWWNNPVNDDHYTFLYMHGLTARWTIEQEDPVPHMRGFLLNPMNQGQASKICLFSAADYSWNPGAFNADTSWEQSLVSITKSNEEASQLKDFISILSAYTTTSGDTPEGEEYGPLYTAFQNAYTKDNIPDATELAEVLGRGYEACLALREYKESDDPDKALFYKDIEPWLNKVEHMCYAALRSFAIMNGESSLDNWTEFSDIETIAKNIHTDESHLMSVLANTGSSNTYESFEEVQPTPKYFDSFIDFLGSVLSNHAPKLPQRDRTPMVITNIENLQGIEIITEESPRGLKHLNGLTLQSGQYIGGYFNNLLKANLELPALPAGLEPEYSVSGKEWTTYTGEDEYTAMAYFRLHNTTENQITLDFDELIYTVPDIVIDTDPVASTNMGTWQSYVIDNVTDGNTDTFFWSNEAQSEGDYVMLDFGASNPRNDITLTFTGNDMPTGSVEIQLSNDDSDWTTISTFTASDITDNVYTCSAAGMSARYVRMHISSVTGGNWLQLSEFSVTSSSGANISVAEDSDNMPIAGLDDRSLSTGYTATEAGSITYRFIENITIEQIQIYHNSNFATDVELPSIELYSGNEWHPAGVLDTPRTDISVPEEMRHITALRISWNSDACPSIYEIMPIGPDYVDMGGSIVSINGTDTAPEISISANNGIINVSAASKISSVTAVDIAGRTVAACTPANNTATLHAAGNNFVIVTITLADGTTTHHKVAVK